MAMAGLCSDEFRLPMCAMQPANREKLAAALKAYGIL
jgi:dihydrodipicolinate synthase/N-acetylneuraminate lyase